MFRQLSRRDHKTTDNIVSHQEKCLVLTMTLFSSLLNIIVQLKTSPSSTLNGKIVLIETERGGERGMERIFINLNDFVDVKHVYCTTCTSSELSGSNI